ncbi:TonB-dependent receptor [Porticoccaceae bacterium]|nr:TonB-dependent receptor [Porticoccaceae bacterium]
MNVSFIKPNSSTFFKIKLLTKVITISLGLSASASMVQAVENDLQYYDIAPNTMSEALKVFALETDSEILFSPSLVADKSMDGLKGEYTRQQALETMLAGAGLEAQTSDEKVFMVVSTETERNKMRANIAAGDSEMGIAEKKGYRNSGIEEITVTANKREQDLQDVAMGLSALTGDDLNRIGAVGAQDYLAQIPGVNYNAQGKGRSPVIVRGISTISTTILSDAQSTSAIYIDDLPSLQRWGAWTNTDPNTFDVERVEVLRGPQGTLFGSGALGGALRVINNKPNASEFQSSIDLGQSFTQGGDDSNSINAMLNIPLVDDELAMRIVAFSRNDGGYIDNTRRDEKNINGGEMEGGRLMLSYKPSEDLSLRLTATHQADIVDDSSATFRDKEDGPRYAYDGVTPEYSDVSISIYNLSADYDLDGALLTSSTTYSKRKSFLNLDLVSLVDLIFETGLEPDENGYSLTEEVETFAQEIRVVSQGDGPAQWTIGAFYLDQKIDTFQDWTADNLGDLVQQTRFLPHITEMAIFGELTYQITDELFITGGGRWFDSSFEFEIPLNIGALANDTLPLTKETSSSFTPKVALSYFLNDDMHIYTSATKGFRVGQINTTVAPEAGVPKSYEPDSLWNYELGLKTLLLDGHLKLNLAAYYIDWTDIQLQRTITTDDDRVFNFNDNAGDATSKGIEMELTYLPNENWEVGIAFSYTDATLETVTGDTGLTPGSTLPGTPDFAMANYVQYVENDMPNNLSGYVRLSHQHVGQMVSNINNADHLYSDTYNTFNLRSGLQYQNYELALYVENLTNDDAATSKYDQDIFNMNTFRAFRLKPRTMGLTLRVDF